MNLSEPGWLELADVLDSAGIAAEAGVWSVADADAIAELPIAGGWLRILVEIVDGPAAGAAGRADKILARLDASPVAAVPRLLHGEGPACWPLVDRAGRLGLPGRAGLEDVLHGPDGQPITGNAELVAQALAVWAAASRAAGRPPG